MNKSKRFLNGFKMISIQCGTQTYLLTHSVCRTFFVCWIKYFPIKHETDRSAVCKNFK